MASQQPTMFLEVPNNNPIIGGSYPNLLRIQDTLIGATRASSFARLDDARGPPILELDGRAPPLERAPPLIVNNNLVIVTVRDINIDSNMKIEATVNEKSDFLDWMK